MKKVVFIIIFIIVILLSLKFYLTPYKVVIMDEKYDLGSKRSILSRIEMHGKIYPQKIVNLVDKTSEMSWSYKWEDLAGLETKAEQTYENINTFSIKIRSILGKYTNIPVVFAYSSELLESRLKNISREIDKDPVDALLIKDGDFQRLVEHKYGYSLDINSSLEKLRKAIGNKNNVIELSVIRVSPENTFESILEEKKVNILISSHTTEFNPDNLNRVANLKLAAQKMNNLIIRPGQIFSFNKFVGERTLSAGFMKAPVILRGKLVDGIAGGICQVTSTLYNAVLLADLKIEKRYPHSIYDPDWAYTLPGFDAAVAYPYKDFIFSNNKPYSILMRFVFEENTLTCDIMGKESLPYKVELVTGNVEKIPFSIKRQSSDKLNKGEEEVLQPGVDGYKAESVLIRKYKDSEERCVLSNDRYLKYDKIIKIGK